MRSFNALFGSTGLGLRKEWPFHTAEELNDIGRLLKLACDGNVQGMMALAAYRIMALEWDKAAEWLIKAANKGDEDAMGLLAVMYSRGLGVPLNEKQGFFWFDKSGGNISLLSQHPPKQFAKEMIAGKTLMQIQVRRRVYDPNDNLTWAFFGAPLGESLFIEIHLTDIEAVEAWSPPQFVHDDTSSEGGFFEQSSICSAYFSIQSFNRAKEHLGRQPFANPGGR